MINPVSILAIAFIVTLLSLMYFGYIQENYIPAVSIKNAIQRNLKHFAVCAGAIIILSAIFDGFHFEKWNWNLLIGNGVGATISFIIDTYALRRKRHSA